MSALDGLDDVPWASLDHAFGNASDVPAMLHALREPEEAEEALADLYGLVHQGTLYTATLPALPFVAALACDPETPERAGLLEFLLSFALSFNEGYAPDPHEDRNPDTFEARARAALRATCEAVAPCLDDADAGIRAGVASLWSQLAPIPEALAAALHRRLAEDGEPRAFAAIAAALRHDGRLTEAERAVVAAAPAAVRFAVAVAALRSRLPIEDADVATAAALWGDCAQDHWPGADELLVELAEGRKAAILPLLDHLAASRRPDLVEQAIEGYAALASVSRSATPGAIDGLLRIAASETRDPRPDTQAARRKLTPILASLVGLEHAGAAIADALCALATADPAPYWIAAPIFRPSPDGPTHDANDLRADAAAALLAIGPGRGRSCLQSAVLPRHDLGPSRRVE